MRYQNYMRLYISERRAFGYHLKCEERYLLKFTKFADERNIKLLEPAHFLAWKEVYGNANLQTWKARLSVYRGFIAWLLEYEPDTKVPPKSLIQAPPRRRPRAYIYSQSEIDSLLQETLRLRSTLGLRRLANHTLISLIHVTGLRINEALALNYDDFDFEKNVVWVRDSKIKEERIVPFREKTSALLKNYYSETSRLIEKRPLRFFVVENGRYVTEHTARYAFSQVSQKIGLRKTALYFKHGRGPRIHDLRHTFAVNVLIEATKDGRDIDEAVFRLCTILGHKDLESTYYYLQSVPELMKLVSNQTLSLELVE